MRGVGGVKKRRKGRAHLLVLVRGARGLKYSLKEKLNFSKNLFKLAI
jgi:hypothetical protein